MSWNRCLVCKGKDEGEQATEAPIPGAYYVVPGKTVFKPDAGNIRLRSKTFAHVRLPLTAVN
jgi:hypothetical protein